MAIFLSLATFFRRHKKKLLITSTVSVSLYFLVQHLVISRFRNFQNALKQELFVKEQIKRRFVQTQTDCYLTILALLPVLTLPVVAYMPTEAITLTLKKKKNSKKELGDSLTTENLMAYSEERTSGSGPDLLVLLAKSKLELWQELIIKSITRILTLIYATSSLLLLTRLQLNILARKSYLELAIVIAGGTVPTTSNDSFNYFIEQSYLSLSWWLLNHGWKDIADVLETLVQAKFADISPKTELSTDTFMQMLAEINIEMLTHHHALLAHLVFPLEYSNLVETLMNTNPELVNELENQDSNLVKLVSETNFIFANDVTSSLLAKLVQNGVDTLRANILLALDPDRVSGRVHKLATFLGLLSVQSGVICDPQSFGHDSEVTGNIYINNLNDLDELDEFSASIYSNFE